jgi:hypothetical protein
MKAKLNSEGEIISWGIAYNNVSQENIIDVPDDYSPLLYDYVDGEFISKDPQQEASKLDELVNAGFTLEQAQLILAITN